MKNHIKTILLLFLTLLFGLFIHPKKVYYEATITGKVTDKAGNPIPNAIVCRMEKEFYKNKKIGSIELKYITTDTVKTDQNGIFKLDKKSRIDWFHTPLDLPIGFCYANFEIKKNGFKTYKTKFGELKQFKKENCYACEKIKFTPIITLIKN
jgi:hypothetical protein